jgi:hypothetical protein
MRNLLRCRRGAVAFATVIALVPLIGVIALGGEAASWYVTKQHAQNAADAAAYSGALKLACTLSGSSCIDQQTVPYRGKEFAAQNGFCNAGDTAYPGSICATTLPTGTSQSVAIVQTTCNGNPCVQATVTQTQPAYLAALLGLTTVNIGAVAKAAVNQSTAKCVLALTGSISFQGSPNINAPGCGLASNDPANNALNFTGGGTNMNIGSISAAGGCTGSTTYCGSALTYQSPVKNPFSALDGALNTLCGANPTLPATCGLKTTGACNTGGLVAYTAATPCTNNNLHITSNTAINLSGVYFISGTLKITGTPVISGTATFILLPGATINNQGNAQITIAGPTTAPSASSLPAALQPDAALFQAMAIYDASSANIQFGGNSNINIKGNIYAPTASVTLQGNPNLTMSNGKSCGQLVAASISFNGNATFDDSGCSTATTPTAQYVTLVQ